MRSAPKDRLLLLAVPHNDGSRVLLVNFGRWVDVPYTSQLNRAWKEHDIRDAQKIPAIGRWLASHTAIVEHGGACTGKTVEEKMYLVDPKYWAELPETPAYRGR